jgi:outer membrane protein OmpA-like peptidoglycan-associated protein
MRTTGLAILLLLAPALCQAQDDWLSRFAVRAESGFALMLPDFQTRMLAEQPGIEGGLHVAFTPWGPLAVQLGFLTAFFPNDMGGGQVYDFGGGLRFEPRIADIGRFGVDFDVDYARTGNKDRFSLDASLSFEFDLFSWLALGPMVRYVHVFAAGGDYPSDAAFFVFGASVAVRIPAEPPRDTDSDGVLDAADECDDASSGEIPDPNRPGCPARDSDEDGILDHLDQCSSLPVGDDPDPHRAGCPGGDSDSDGVLDRIDECPALSGGLNPDASRLGCPIPDMDHDSIPDERDTCPELSQGLAFDPERVGCPASDRDHDSVSDTNDACPDEAGAPHPDARRNGCPSLVRIEYDQIIILRPIFFAQNSDTILARSLPVLEAMADALNAMPAIRRISIEGHTDDVADDELNLDLSTRRANNVMAWLVRAGGIAAQRMEAHGYGETRPIDPATTEQARATNRRVEFLIVDPEGLEP